MIPLLALVLLSGPPVRAAPVKPLSPEHLRTFDHVLRARVKAVEAGPDQTTKVTLEVEEVLRGPAKVGAALVVYSRNPGLAVKKDDHAIWLLIAGRLGALGALLVGDVQGLGQLERIKIGLSATSCPRSFSGTDNLHCKEPGAVCAFPEGDCRCANECQGGAVPPPDREPQFTWWCQSNACFAERKEGAACGPEGTRCGRCWGTIDVCTGGQWKGVIEAGPPAAPPPR